MNQLTLTEMTPEEFVHFERLSIQLYANEQLKNPLLTEAEALEIAQKSFDTILPEGMATPHQYFFQLHHLAKKLPVGHLWFGRKSEGTKHLAYLYDIYLYPDFRGQGLGEETMKLLEVKVKDLGLHHIGLHVFGHNQRARQLYQKLHYKETNVIMLKEL